MTSKASSHQHGMASVNMTRPKSTLPKRKNKAQARVLRAVRQENINKVYQEALTKIA